MRAISRKGLIKKIDKIFSEYIRKRDANTNGVCKCVTCNREFHYTKLDAGHFISRKHMATRWDERNVASQCYYCNRYQNGRQFAFSLHLDKQQEGLAKELYDKSCDVVKYTTDDLHELVNHYKTLLEKENKRLSL